MYLFVHLTFSKVIFHTKPPVLVILLQKRYKSHGFAFSGVGGSLYFYSLKSAWTTLWDTTIPIFIAINTEMQ